MKIEELKKLIGKKVKVSYLDWGDSLTDQGILTKINKRSIVLDNNRLISTKDLEVKHG